MPSIYEPRDKTNAYQAVKPLNDLETLYKGKKADDPSRPLGIDFIAAIRAKLGIKNGEKAGTEKNIDPASLAEIMQTVLSATPRKAGHEDPEAYYALFYKKLFNKDLDRRRAPALNFGELPQAVAPKGNFFGDAVKPEPKPASKRPLTPSEIIAIRERLTDTFCVKLAATFPAPPYLSFRENWDLPSEQRRAREIAEQHHKLSLEVIKEFSGRKSDPKPLQKTDVIGFINRLPYIADEQRETFKNAAIPVFEEARAEVLGSSQATGRG